jgi:hypothetical protein
MSETTWPDVASMLVPWIGLALLMWAMREEGR